MSAVPVPVAGLLAVVGDLHEDIVVWAAGELRYGSDTACTVWRSRGGSAANVAALAAGIVPTRFIGCVGPDAAGDQLVADLARHGVDVRVQRGTRTGTCVILVDATGERTMFPDRAASAELADVPLAWLDGVQLLHAPSYAFGSGPAAGATEDLLRSARRSGIAVSLDASSTAMLEEYGRPRYLDLVDRLRPTLFFANAQEAAILDVTRPQFHDALCVVKDGAAPTRIVVSGRIVETIPVPALDAVRDSTGAGDAFAAGFLAAHLRGLDPASAVRAGHERARTVLLSPGATTSRPTSEGRLR
jgi:sugar/nucleoside kinase (ribokinase family)